ncbi:MAG: response regulator transcription factor [Armatimonas sp.]
MSVSLLLADDHAIWREGVAAMLRHTEFTIVGEAANGVEAAQLTAKLTPQIVLLDIRMAGGDGLEALVSIKEANPDTHVILLTTYDNPTYIARAVAGGASAYLHKDLERNQLLTTLRSVASGEILLSKNELGRSLSAVGEQSATLPDLDTPLTRREEEVLALIARGLANKEIAKILFIGDGTVKTHVERIIAKLGVADRTQAAIWALQNNFAELQ